MNFPRTALDNNIKAKVLLIRFSALGDIVLTAHIGKKLKELFPSFEITWLTEKGYAPLAQCMPWIDEVMPWDRQEGQKGFLKLVSRIRREKFDILLNLQDNDRTALLTLLTSIPLKIGFHRHFQFIYHQDIYAALGKLGIPPCLEKRIHSSLERPAGDSPLSSRLKVENVRGCAALAIGASTARKRWPAAYWARLIDYLSQEDCMAVLVGAGAEELRMSEEIMALCPGKKILNLVDTLSLLDLLRVLADVSFAVAADTGPLHMARALGTPVIAMFGPTSLSISYTQSFDKVVYTSCEKMGCLDWKCVLPCMEHIVPQEVIKAAKEILESVFPQKG